MCTSLAMRLGPTNTLLNVVGGYGAIGQYFPAHPSLKTSVAWGTAMFSVSLATNIIVTGLTAGRIWYITRPRAFSLPGSTSGKACHDLTLCYSSLKDSRTPCRFILHISF